MDSKTPDQYPSPKPLSARTVTTWIKLGRRERQRYQQHGQTHSPILLALFKQAFRRDPLAATAICEIFTPLVKRWVSAFCQLDHDDVAQQAWLQFWRYAPHLANLRNAAELGPILLYLRQCAKTAGLMALRQQKQTVTLEAVAELPDATSIEQRIITRLTLRDCLQRLLRTEDEQLIFRWRFEWGATPQEIVAQQRERFPSLDQVYQIIQRLTRRLRRDETLREMAGWAGAKLGNYRGCCFRPKKQLPPAHSTCTLTAQTTDALRRRCKRQRLGLR